MTAITETFVRLYKEGRAKVKNFEIAIKKKMFSEEDLRTVLTNQFIDNTIDAKVAGELLLGLKFIKKIEDLPVYLSKNTESTQETSTDNK